MSSTTVSIENLADAILEALEDYQDVTEEVVNEAVTKVAKETKEMVKAASPSNTGKYASGWTTKKTSTSSSAPGITVYNKNKPGLAHLLEHGHAKVGGGRVAAQTHIAPAEEYAIEELESQIKKGLS